MTKKIRIDRTKWARGKTFGTTNWLWSWATNKGCCLGHAIHQVSKCSWLKLSNSASPDLFFKRSSFLTYMVPNKNGSIVINNRLADLAIEYNDAPFISDSDREETLIKLFKEHGYELEFYN